MELTIFPEQIDFPTFSHTCQFCKSLHINTTDLFPYFPHFLFFFTNLSLTPSFFHFHASKQLDGLTGWALETRCLSPDPPESLLPH